MLFSALSNMAVTSPSMKNAQLSSTQELAKCLQSRQHGSMWWLIKYLQSALLSSMRQLARVSVKYSPPFLAPACKTSVLNKTQLHAKTCIVWRKYAFLSHATACKAYTHTWKSASLNSTGCTTKYCTLLRMVL